MHHVAPTFRSSSRPVHVISLKQVLKASVGAVALFGRDALAAPLTARDSVNLGSNGSPAHPATRAQISALANAKVEPAFNIKGVSATMKTPSNFNLYPNGNPSPADIDQTVVGDCYLDSVLAAFAQQGRTVVQDMITTNKDGTFTLHMYDPVGNALDVTVNNEVPETAQSSVVGDAGPTGSANWATLAEKAYAKYNDEFHTVSAHSGYDGIATGGDPGAVFKAFMGVQVDYAWHNQMTTSNARNAFASTLKQALSSGKPVVAAAEHSSTLSTGAQIVGSHAYTLMAVDQDSSGPWFVDIRNPWGFTANVPNSSHSTDDGVLRITFDDYMQAMVLTYIPTSAVKGADDSDTYHPRKGQQPVDGGTGGITSSASRTKVLGLSGLGTAVLAGAATLLGQHLLA